MVKLTSAVLARPPHLIYGVKRGKVPTSLRPNVILRKQALGSKYFECFRHKFLVQALTWLIHGKHPKNDIGVNDIIKYNFADQERFLLQNSARFSWITCLHITAPSVIEDGYDHFVARLQSMALPHTRFQDNLAKGAPKLRD